MGRSSGRYNILAARVRTMEALLHQRSAGEADVVWLRRVLLQGHSMAVHAAHQDLACRPAHYASVATMRVRRDIGQEEHRLATRVHQCAARQRHNLPLWQPVLRWRPVRGDSATSLTGEEGDGQCDVLQDAPLPERDVVFVDNCAADDALLNVAGARAVALLTLQRWMRGCLARRRERRLRCQQAPRAVQPAVPLERAGQSRPRCRYGASCPFHRAGRRCHYAHLPGDDAELLEDPPSGQQLLRSCTLQPGTNGHGIGALLAPWLDRTNPHTIELHDPYLGAIRSGQAHGGSRFGVLPSDDLAAAVADHGLAAATNLWLVQEFLQEVAGRAPQLRTVRITMRDLLRAPDVSLRPLLPAWTTEMSDTWGGAGHPDLRDARPARPCPPDRTARCWRGHRLPHRMGSLVLC